MRIDRIYVALICIVVIAVLASYSSPITAMTIAATTATATPAVVPTSAALSPSALANAEYQSEYTKSGTVKLENGEYREPVAPGSATETVVQLTKYVAYGELDGQPAAAVVLVTNPGGSGTF